MARNNLTGTTQQDEPPNSSFDFAQGVRTAKLIIQPDGCGITTDRGTVGVQTVSCDMRMPYMIVLAFAFIVERF